MDQIASDQLADFGYEPELLEALRIMTENSEDIPVSSNWILASVILDDGFRQLFQPETTLEMIPAIVDEMNKTYSEYRK
jgi:hypothetical protein